MKRTSRRDGRDGTRHVCRGPAPYAQEPFATSTIAVTSRVMAAIGSSSVTRQWSRYGYLHRAWYSNGTARHLGR